jgi:putative endopeptidase
MSFNIARGGAIGLNLPACVVSIGIAFTGIAFAQSNDHPLLGEHGYDLDAVDRSERPGDGFFRYATGAWLDRTQIPPDKYAVTRRTQMNDRIESRLHETLEGLAAQAPHRPTELEGKVGAFYKAFMNEARIDRVGARPLTPELAAVRACRTASDIAAQMGHANVGLESTFFDLATDVDFKDAQRYAVRLTQSGLGLPDRDYYLLGQFAAQRRAYRAYIARLLKLLHWTAAEERADAILQLEIRIAAASWSRVQDRDLNTTYNALSVAQLEQLAPGFDWRAFLAAAQLSHLDRVIVSEPSAFTGIAALFADASLATLQAWQAFHVADNAAPYLSRPFADAWFEFRGRVLSGQERPGPRWRRGVTAVSGDTLGSDDRFGNFGTLGWAVGEIYTARYFPPASKAKVQELVGHLLDSYRDRLERLDWMGPETRAEALRKLATYSVKVGYPDHPRDYAGLQISDDDLIGDLRHVAAANWEHQVRRLPGPVDRSAWEMTPQTNNAYNGWLRDIVFPAGILQPPIFDVHADAGYNYGAVGGVIGHELTHGFDDQGRAIDATGELRDWWTASDAATFDARARQLSAQYSGFHPIPGDMTTHVNGDLTLGENIADLGGLTLALDAYRASLGGQPAPMVDGFTGDQRVFLGWAQAWAGKLTEDYIRKMVVSDPHTPRQFRVDGVVRNIDAWYAAFDIQPGDKLYLSPEQRVHIW